VQTPLHNFFPLSKQNISGIPEYCVWRGGKRVRKELLLAKRNQKEPANIASFTILE